MASTPFAAVSDLGREPAIHDTLHDPKRIQCSAVSWSAIIAGAAAAAALSLILLLLGVGLGLSAISPWSYEGVSGTTIGVSTILWITLTQLAASGMGGYLAGRLRTKWLQVHADEVYFRDTAHGFLAWAVASLATAALLTSAVGSIIGGGVKAGTSVASGVANAAAAGAGGGAVATATMKSGDDSASFGYFVDSLFRRDLNGATAAASSPPVTSASVPSGYSAPTPSTAGMTSEVNRIFVSNIQFGALPADDTRYVGQLVAQRSGLTQQEAEKRVSDTYARLQLKIREFEAMTKEAADKARKASSYAALWLFISMLAGAFVASLAATYGGRRRDA